MVDSPEITHVPFPLIIYLKNNLRRWMWSICFYYLILAYISMESDRQIMHLVHA